MKILHENFHKKSLWTFWISNFEIFDVNFEIRWFFLKFLGFRKNHGKFRQIFDGNLSQKRFVAFIGVLQECSQKRFGPFEWIFWPFWDFWLKCEIFWSRHRNADHRFWNFGFGRRNFDLSDQISTRTLKFWLYLTKNPIRTLKFWPSPTQNRPAVARIDPRTVPAIVQSDEIRLPLPSWTLPTPIPSLIPSISPPICRFRRPYRRFRCPCRHFAAHSANSANLSSDLFKNGRSLLQVFFFDPTFGFWRNFDSQSHQLLLPEWFRRPRRDLAIDSMHFGIKKASKPLFSEQPGLIGVACRRGLLHALHSQLKMWLKKPRSHFLNLCPCPYSECP